MKVSLFANGGASDRKKAIAYYRHSAEDKQENSVPIQRDHIEAFAAQHQIDIIHEEADEGKTGLLASRPGFTALFRDWVENAAAPHFEYVLVLDVSRWGRFQDQDQAAHYEYICTMRGKKVIYVSRGFPKEEHKLIGNLQTSIERYMAAEYSRQLSDKVFHGCVHISKQGFSAGGPPCYGMRRVLLDESHKPIRVLHIGEHKQISNQRVTFAPANDGTTMIIQGIFRAFVSNRQEPPAIARTLNEQDVPSPSGGPWSTNAICRILAQEAYIGTRVYNKTWNRLKQGRRRNPAGEWIRTPNAFAGTVDPVVFRQAQILLGAAQPAAWVSPDRLRKALLRQIQSFFVMRGYGEVLWMIRRSFPLTCSIALARGLQSHWHFPLREGLARHKHILCAGWTAGGSLVCFLVPRSAFGTCGMWTVNCGMCEQHPQRVSGDKLSDVILSMADECLHFFA